MHGDFHSARGKGEHERQHTDAVKKLLIILDDVRSASLSQVSEITRMKFSAVILTTRSTNVKEFLKQLLVNLTVIDMKAFSQTESWQLLKKKVPTSAMSEKLLALTKVAVRNILGHLPLCVGVYASLLGFLLKEEKIKGPEFVHFYDQSMLLANWKEIEEEFGDLVHVRGLAGVVKSAEKYLEDPPYVVFLLTKICCADSESIPWAAIYKPRAQHSLHFNETQYDQLQSGGCAWLFWKLLGVLDFLFSAGGENSLELC